MKIKQSETVEVKRSQIRFAPFNPRKHSEKVIESLKKNFKKIGFLGGVVWNEQSGNLVSGHKRIEALDMMNKYDGNNDYVVKVERVILDDKSEKEQNIYMNNTASQGEFDYQKLASLVSEIDIECAELTEFQIEKIRVFAPEIDSGFNVKVDENKVPATPEKIQELKDLKKSIMNDTFDRHDELNNSHLTIVFNSWEEKVGFCETFNIDIDSKFIKYEQFSAKTLL